MGFSSRVAALTLLVGAGCTPALAHEPTRIPLGDGHASTTGARHGFVYACRAPTGQGGGSLVDGPWLNGDGTWNRTVKVFVDGASPSPQAFVSINERRGRLLISSNSLPKDGRIGTFPIAPEDDAFQFDMNPNAVAPQTVSLSLPARPKRADRPSCLSGGPIGYMSNGVAFFNALDAPGRDAVAHEVQDVCDGHPQQSGYYHYHSASRCLTTYLAGKFHSGLIGYALDGFGLYGPRGKKGELLENGDLDVCHGHSHKVKLRGRKVTTYHYHATLEYPYTLGCYTGTPVSTGRPLGGGGGLPPPPPPSG